MGSMTQAYPAQTYRRKPGTLPTATYFNGGTGLSQGLTVGSITLPGSGIANGDIGIITATWPPTSITPLSTPSGWTLISYRPNIPIPNGLTTQPSGQGPNVCTYIWRKVLTTGDNGATFSTTISAAGQPVAMSGVVIHGTSGLGGIAVSHTNYGYNNSLFYFDGAVFWPAAYPGPQDYVVLLGGAVDATSNTTTNPLLLAAPTGATIQTAANSSAQPSNGIFNFAPVAGSWMCSIPSASFQGVVLNTTCNDSSTGGPGGDLVYVGGTTALWFSPAGHKQTDLMPADITSTAALWSYGHSYGTYVPPSLSPTAVPNVGTYSQALYYRRMQHTLQQSGYLTAEMPNDYNISGSMLCQQTAGAFGTVVQTTNVAGTANAYAINAAQTWTPLTTNVGSTIIFVDGNFNDLRYDTQQNTTAAPTALYQADSLNGTDALVRLLRCSAIHPSSSGTQAGSWSSASSTSYNSGTAFYSTTPTSSITITTTSQNIDLILLGLDFTQNIGNGNPGQQGANYTWTASNGGVQFASGSGTTNNQMAWAINNGIGAGAGGGNYSQNYFAQMCVPIYGMPAGTNTIVLTHAGPSGAYLYYNGWLDQSQTITPWVIMCKTPDQLNYALIQAGHGTPPFNLPPSPYINQSIVDLYNAQYDTVAARFSDGRVLVYDPCASYNDILWDYNVHLNLDDLLHMVEPGSAYRSHNMMRFIQARIP